MRFFQTKSFRNVGLVVELAQSWYMFRTSFIFVYQCFVTFESSQKGFKSEQSNVKNDHGARIDSINPITYSFTVCSIQFHTVVQLKTVRLNLLVGYFSSPGVGQNLIDTQNSKNSIGNGSFTADLEIYTIPKQNQK